VKKAVDLVITTDRRVYRIQLASRASAAMSAISWTYPADEMQALARERAAAAAAAPVSAAVAVDRLNFHYRISGDKPTWRPLRAFDDGRQTWIEFSPTLAVGEAPPLFILGDNGEAELVNYRVSGRYYIVDRLFGAAELRLGAKKQKIVRITRLGAAVAQPGQGE
jgi:type IV secretion system protein VirB9